MIVQSPITTHVLDISRGLPAVGVAVRLERCDAAGQWQLVGDGITNADGRVTDITERDTLTADQYRLTFATSEYFSALGVSTFYPRVVVEFTVTKTTDHYHVPLLMSPFGYSTYRGS